MLNPQCANIIFLCLYCLGLALDANGLQFMSRRLFTSAYIGFSGRSGPPRPCTYRSVSNPVASVEITATYPVCTGFNNVRSSIIFLSKLNLMEAAADSVLVLDDDKIGDGVISQSLLYSTR